MDKNLILNLVAIALMIIALFSSSMPSLSNISLLWIVIIIAAVLIMIFLVDLIANFFIGLIKRTNTLEEEKSKLSGKIEELNKEIDFLKERFKTLEDFAEVKAMIKLIVQRGKINGKRRSS